MEKLFAGLYIIIIALSFSCGFLLLHINDLQSQNSAFERQLSEYLVDLYGSEKQIEELEKQANKLENQIDELEEQIFLERKAEEGAIEITKIEVSEDSNPSLFVVDVNVSVTIHNYRTSDVNLLVLSLGGDTLENADESVGIGNLQAGGTKTLTFHVIRSMDSGPDVVTLWLNGEVLDREHF